MEKTPEYKVNWEAFQKELRSGNLKKYGGEYVGFHDGKIVAHSEDVAQVLKKLEELEPDPKKRFVEKCDFSPDEPPFWYVPAKTPKPLETPAKTPKSVKEVLAKDAEIDIDNDKATFTIDLDEYTSAKVAQYYLPTLDPMPTFFPIREKVMTELFKISPESPKHYDVDGTKIFFTIMKSQSEPSFLQRLDKDLQDKIVENRPLTIADKSDILSRLGVY